jgi:hypothetical protein
MKLDNDRVTRIAYDNIVGMGENKMVLFGSKFWVSRTVRTLTIAVLAPFTKKTRRHPFSIPRPPFICNHVSLASHLIVVWTA